MFRRLFRDVPEAHVATVDHGGEPHVVPLWFVWLDDAVYLTCREGSRVAANLDRRQRAALSIDRGVRWTEHQGVLIRGGAERLPPDHASAKRALSAWFEKYREHLSGRGFAAYAEAVIRPVVVRIHLDRIASWSHVAP
jgi:nitroimidazol reductase NimA-like FMN-containing flavoprotein (pyridoxamine 5'-phosphate oxidase superfamily)